MSGPLGNLADLATDVIESAGYVGVGALVVLANVFPPIPVEVVLLLAGFVAGEGRLWLPAVVVAATVGSVVGALALYAAGYWLGEERVRKLVRRFGRFLLLKETDLDRAQRWSDRHGGKAVLIGRILPGVRKLVPIAAGIACMPIKRFAVYVALANGFLNTALVSLGWVLGDQWRVIRPYAHFLEYGVLVGLAAAALWFVWHRKSDGGWQRRSDGG